MYLPEAQSGFRTGMVLSALILVLLLCSTQLYSQPSDAYVTMTGPQMPGNTYEGTYYVFLSDTSNTSEIEIKLGTATGLDDVMSYTYIYDVGTGLPGGYSYARTGNKLTLGISSYAASNTWFGSVRIKNNSGTWSDSFQFISN